MHSVDSNGVVEFRECQPKPQPQKQYKYEKVKSVFQINKDEMHEGAYCQLFSGDYYVKHNECDVVQALTNDELYRKIEIDPVNELIEDFARLTMNKTEMEKLSQRDCEVIEILAAHAIDKLGVK
jgi:hypothetical protein